MEQLSPAAALAAVTEYPARLRALLERYEPEVLVARPPNGDWSAIENIRHLLYAEQHHLGRFVPGGLGLSPLGLPQGRHAAVTSGDPKADLKAAFDEWARVHAAAGVRLDLTLPGLGLQLPRLMRHQVAHGRLAARALSHATGQPVRVPKPMATRA